MNQEFQDFIKSFQWIERKTTDIFDGEPVEYDSSYFKSENWFRAGPDIPSWDFNKEICRPGQSEKFPEGAVGIRCDDDFWLIGIFPFKFADVPLTEIVEACWPEAFKEAVYHDDVEYDHDDCGFVPKVEVNE